MSGGFTQVGPVFCFIQVLPHSKLQSTLVEEMKVLRGDEKGRTSQETFRIGVGRRTFQMEGSAQMKPCLVQ